MIIETLSGGEKEEGHATVIKEVRNLNPENSGDGFSGRGRAASSCSLLVGLQRPLCDSDQHCHAGLSEPKSDSAVFDSRHDGSD